MRKLKCEDVSLKFPNLGDLKRCKIMNFNDASYCKLPEEGSQGGFIIFLCNKDGKAAPIQWQSRKIRCVVKSTLAAECLAQVEAAEACFLIKSQLAELLQASKEEIITECITDNQSLQDICYSTRNIEDRRLRVDIVILREMLAKNEINKIEWVETSSQLSDCLTKSGDSTALLLDALRSGSLQFQKNFKGAVVSNR